VVPIAVHRRCPRSAPRASRPLPGRQRRGGVDGGTAGGVAPAMARAERSAGGLPLSPPMARPQRQERLGTGWSPRPGISAIHSAPRGLPGRHGEPRQPDGELECIHRTISSTSRACRDLAAVLPRHGLINGVLEPVYVGCVSVMMSPLPSSAATEMAGGAHPLPGDALGGRTSPMTCASGR